jgi:iron complex outermembrane receptor protein
MVVSATRTERPMLDVPFAVDVFRASDLPGAEAGLSLAEKLRFVPGLVVDNRQNLAQGDRITMRGVGARASFGVRGIRLVLDGIPLTMPDGQAQLNNLDLIDIGQVEVLHGPSAALYGNASGGVMLLHSSRGKGKPFSVRPSVVIGGDGLRRVQVQASGTSGNHHYAVNGYRLQSDGYRDFSAGRSWALNANTTYQVSDRLSLVGVIHHVDSPFLLNPSSLDRAVADSLPRSARFFVRSQGAGKSILQTQGGMTVRYVGKALRVESTIYGLRRALYNPVPGRVIDLDRKAGGWRTVVSADQSRVWWTVGLDIEAQRDARQEFVNEGLPDGQGVSNSDILKAVRLGPLLQDQDESVTGLGPFGQLGWKMGPQWVVGVRYDHFAFDVVDQFLTDGVNASGSRVMGQWSPSLGLTFRASERMSVYANMGTAFQTPTTTELGNQPGGVGGFNPDLQPEKMRSFELGLKGFSPKGALSYGLAGYVMRIKHMLIPFQVEASEEIYYRNAGKTRNVGFETHLRWTASEAFRVDLSYSAQRFTFSDYRLDSGAQLSGNRVPGVPPHRLTVGLGFSHPGGAFAEVHAQATGQVFTNDGNGPPEGSSKSRRDFVNDRVVTIDLRLGLRRSIIQGFLGLNNVFDTRYNSSIVPNAFGDRFFEPAAGRMLYAGLSAHVD